MKQEIIKKKYRKVYPAYGKHIIEKHMNEYVSKDEFILMMKDLGYNSNKYQEYSFVIRPDKYFHWA
jgi:hypothetical protein